MSVVKTHIYNRRKDVIMHKMKYSQVEIHRKIHYKADSETLYSLTKVVRNYTFHVRLKFLSELLQIEKSVT